MSSSTGHWLERLLKVTDYRELREIYAQIQRDALSGTNPTALIQHIDEAVQRIDYESHRDEEEWRSRRQAYDAFLAEQRGCLGWLRRMWPWSQTRRAERQHQVAVAEQRSEILANQLIVARARMLQERLRDPQLRRVGPPRKAWEPKLDSIKHIDDLARGAAVVRELVAEIDRAKEFLDDVEKRIEQFSKASFAQPEYRQWRDADLAEAQNECQALRSEVQEKESLSAETTSRLARLAHDELSTRHPGFRELQTKLSDVDQFLKIGQSARSAVQELSDQLTRYQAAVQVMNQAPHQRIDWQRQAAELRSQWNTRQATLQQLQRETNDHQERMNRTARDASQVEGAMRTAEKMFQAYLAERRIVEMPPPGDPIYSSPVAAEYQRLQREWQHSQQQLQQTQRAFHEAQQRVQRAMSESQSIKQQEDDFHRRIAELEQQLQQAQQVADSWRRALPGLHAKLDEHWSGWSRFSAGQVSAASGLYRAVVSRLQHWGSTMGGFRGAGTSPDDQAAAETLTEANRLIEAVDHELSEQQRQAEAWRNRAHHIRWER
ncbi:MAG TPA: hypothetical protein PKD54_05870, partial [Pirellulaceae bacterium]|nr:hypothetical protein [Pirellulaceae bacterium]